MTMPSAQGILGRLWTRVNPSPRSAGSGRLVDNTALRPRIEQVVEAVGDRMFPSGGAIPYSARDVGLREYMLDFLGKIPADKSNMICLLLLGYEFAFPILTLKGLQFTQMSEEKQLEMLEEMQESSLYPFRILNVVVRMFMTFGYLADERVLEEMGHFKTHAYPQDPRVIRILENLPWETRPAPSEEASKDAPEADGEALQDVLSASNQEEPTTTRSELPA
jgi:hypothetical protein